MNHRAPLREADILRNLAPVAPNVTKLPPGGPPPAPRGRTSVEKDGLRRDALEALHSYLVAATDYDLPRTMVIFRRVTTTLDNQLAAGR